MRQIISVVVPVYNIKDYVQTCVESIQKQTFRDLEIILVDDGSNDGSSAICEELASHDGRITVIRQPNQGLSAARNTGTCAAQGEWLVFVDGDDVVCPNYIRSLYDAANMGNSDIAVCSFTRIQSQQDNFDCFEFDSYSAPAEVLDSTSAVEELFSEKKDQHRRLGEIGQNCYLEESPFPCRTLF
jgi:glycosyltransferase involved in cell wall biosynthesis